MKSVMQHQFSQIPRAEIERSSFDRSHGHKTTFDAGYLIPVFLDEALPGDTFNLNMTCFARLATPIFPLMDNMYLESFFFAVPNRLLWSHWQQFCGEQPNPGDSTSFVIPQSAPPNGSAYAVGDLQDYMGLPVGINNTSPNNIWSHSALFCRAYNLIWNAWFRDENLQTQVAVPIGDGPDASSNFVLKRRGKRHDYFTSCLPWPQKSANPVTLPLGTSAPIVSDATTPAYGVSNWLGATAGHNYGGLGSDSVGGPNPIWQAANPGVTENVNVAVPVSMANVAGHLHADLAGATAATINAIRQAFQIQKLYERDARGGTRYTEIVHSHFGVVSPDARLQRPEYLGGGSTPIIIHPVAQTSVSGSTPQGHLAAFGTAQASGHGFSKSFTEHCTLVGLVCVRADLNYSNNINKMWSRSTRFDFYWPSLAHLGEQAVLNKEIFLSSVTSVDEAVFGYQERYAEYRYKPSMITGKFRPFPSSGSLSAWHLEQDLSYPALNDAFIQENPPVARVIAVNTEPHFIFDSYIGLRCARPMPVYSVPGLIDHF